MRNNPTEYREEEDRRKVLEARTIDFLVLGEMQPEWEHNVQAGGSSFVGDAQGRKWRDARDGGWFEFTMAIVPDGPVDLICTFWGGDGGREFDILADGTKITTQVLDARRPDHFLDVIHSLPLDLTRGKTMITVRLQSRPGRTAGGLFGCRTARQES